MAEKLVALINRSNGPRKFVYEGETIILPPDKKTKRQFLLSKLPNLNPQDIKILK